MRITFKVHKVEPRDIVNGAHRHERVTLHPIDPHEAGPHEHARESRSGEGKMVLNVNEPSALHRFKVGQYVTVTIDIPE